jgi:hypothetical protein
MARSAAVIEDGDLSPLGDRIIYFSTSGPDWDVKEE